MDAFFGELYLRSTLPFLSEEVTAREAEYLSRAFADVEGPVVDLGCGHGRHAARLNAEGGLAGRVVGLELDPLSLRLRRPGFPVAQGDLRALPFQDASVGGAYAWYSTLFAFSDAEHVQVLREAARVLRPGGRLVFQTVPYERLARSPGAAFHQRLPDGSLLEEESRFDATRGRDVGQRRLTLPDGRVLRAAYAIRYYPLAELKRLLESTGFSVAWVHGGLDSRPMTPDSTDLIVGAGRG
ncbi:MULTISPECIES: methyltransferase domain-containing protein [Corallococcus]|uniref:methyltransferase domain-containing protein n=1 Tax=Corallococcus TaxID=83461 RepID=UPI00117C3654|nr:MULTISPECIES: methyltransferase domain-containing protein [Corallococcus]NBD11201.1 methyltransferase domain-containing protein [Corallococcus silvisoli]TSC26605.1 methyltransferase domain-containing protein [Corallococcus sp. Z5C101001]